MVCKCYNNPVSQCVTKIIFLSDGDDKLKKAEKSFVPLLDWDIVHKKMAWGVLLLMGGGFALADACSVRTSSVNYVAAQSIFCTFLTHHPVTLQ